MKLRPPTIGAAGAAAALAATALVAVPAHAASVTIHVTPEGGGDQCTAEAPCSLTGAQERVRELLPTADGDIVVQVADGTYRLSAPLEFRPEDGGTGDVVVRWQAAPGAQPIITGAIDVGGWSVHDEAANIYVTDTPAGLDSRQLYVNGLFAPKASILVPNDDLGFSPEGITIKNPDLAYLETLPQQERIEFESMGDFTNRYSPVQSISGDLISMVQPAWDNNTWGWDTPQYSLLGASTYFLSNSLAFLDDVGEWFIDPEAGKLYYKPGDGVDPESLEIELPTTESLLSIGGTYDEPVENLEFRGMTFTGTSWLGPSVDGYANQQNGSFLKGAYDYRPEDAFDSCSRGCELFERARSGWYQQPAAVQVSAAKGIGFHDNLFVNLGSSALGIGNDANAHATGVGLGAERIEVIGNRFTEVAGHGINVGGNRPDSHHPSDERMTNRDITIRHNTINRAAIQYKDNSGILSTYVSGADISDNEVANVPYDAIDTGYGWGMHDEGGSPEYEDRGYYNWNTRYDTPTTLRDIRVAGNLIHNTKARFHDGGSLYNLSSSPGSVTEENYLYNISGVALYLDEGTRHTTYQRNVLQGANPWVFTNSYGTRQTTKDNLVRENWFNSGGEQIPNAELHNNRIVDNIRVEGTNWPAEAREVICRAGVAPEYRTTLNGNFFVEDAACGQVGEAVGGAFQTAAGSAVDSHFAQAGDSFALRAAGADVWGAGGQKDDEFGAIYEADSINGASSVSARLDSLNDAHAWAKSGVMIRNDIAAPGESAGYAVMTVTKRNGVSFQWDSDGDGYLDSAVDERIDTFRPVWVKLVRNGDSVSGHYSYDGVNYVPVGEPVALPGIEAVQDGGIFSTSHDRTQSAINVFSNVVVESDDVRPEVTLVSPSAAGPHSALSLQVDATDDRGLARIVANVYQGSTLVKSTQTQVEGGALAATHAADVELPDGNYTIRYNAHDLAGNVSRTGTLDVTVDQTPPTATVKDGEQFTVQTGDTYDRVSFKLYDAGKVDRVELNGIVKDLVNDRWSDVNFIAPGVFGAVQGENTLVVFDVAGNATTVTFVLN